MFMSPDRPQFTIRRYLPADLVRLHEIDRSCFPPAIAYSLGELRFYLAGRKAVGLVAEILHQIAGFAVGRCEENSVAHVITLDVVPEARRQGIGKALMDALHEEFDRQGVTAVILEVSVENLEARRFYEKLGYRAANLLRGYYNGEVDAYRMIRPGTAAGDRKGR